MATEKLNKTKTNYLTVTATYGGMFANQTFTTLIEAIAFVVSQSKGNNDFEYNIYKCEKIV